MTFSVPTTLNPADKAASVTLSLRDLRIATSGIGLARSLTKVSSGKWYVEFTRATSMTGWYFGLANVTASLTNYAGQNVNSIGLTGGSIYYNNASLETVSALNALGTIGVAIDADARTVRFFNATGTTTARAVGLTGDIYLAGSNQFTSSGSLTLNAGETPFAFTVPSGYTPGFALRAANGVSGNVKDASGANAARTVRLLRRDTGAVAHEVTSDASTGDFLLVPYPNDAVAYLVEALPTSTSENALVFDRVVAA